VPRGQNDDKMSALALDAVGDGINDIQTAEAQGKLYRAVTFGYLVNALYQLPTTAIAAPMTTR
jgi:phosphoglycolate phosphatase-like HAD superfamily hydrolase